MRDQPHEAATPASAGRPEPLVPLLRVVDVAAFLNISPRTVRQMVRDGRLAAVATSVARGRLRISREAIAAFLRAAGAEQTKHLEGEQ